MAYFNLFSKRYNLRPTPDGLMYENVPERPRIGLYHIIEKYFGGEYQRKYSELYGNICVALRIPHERRIGVYDSERTPYIEKIINTCLWWQFYDICEVMWDTISSGDFVSEIGKFSKEVNELFREEQLGFKLSNGKVQKIGSGFIDANINETRFLLKEPEFKSADELFEKAIKALNERPKPDVENCIKDAVSAIESIARILTNNEKALLSDFIKESVQNNVIPKPLDQTFQKIYAYRGNEPGVAHGAIKPSKVTEDEAELVLAMSAAMIIYLVKKRSQLS